MLAAALPGPAKDLMGGGLYRFMRGALEGGYTVNTRRPDAVYSRCWVRDTYENQRLEGKRWHPHPSSWVGQCQVTIPTWRPAGMLSASLYYRTTPIHISGQMPVWHYGREYK